MTDISEPGERGAAASNRRFAHAIQKAGGHDGYVVDGVDLAANEPGIDETGINAFAHDSNNGLDVTLDGGEAFCAGWLARDRQSTVTVPSNTTSTIYVGFDVSAILGSGEGPTDNDNIIVGVDADFDAPDPRLPLYEVTAGNDTISSVDSVRPLGPSQASSAMFATKQEFNDLINGGTFTGDVTFETLSVERVHLTEGSGSTRIIYDDGFDGNALHIQRDLQADETAVTIEGTNVGINQTNPSSPFHVGERATFDEGVEVGGGMNPELPDDAFTQSAGLADYPRGYTVFRDSQGSFPMGSNSVVETLDSQGPNNGFQVNWDSGNDEYAYRIATNGDTWRPWHYPVRAEEALEIQIDGTDGAGILNFKTQ